jgi:dCTP deaminase
MIVNGASLLAAAPIKDMLTTKERAHGVSYGLAEAGYDIRIKQDITFIPAGHYQYIPEQDPNVPYVRMTRKLIGWDTVFSYDPSLGPVPTEGTSGRFTIASAIEEFQMPHDLVGVVHDKSTWARRGLSVFNTVIEPGWKGFLTLELIYHGNEPLHIKAGSGIAQILFSRVENPAAYDGKYQNQADRPVAAIYEKG